MTTLLDDPLASDDRVALTLESRRLDPNAPEAILIRLRPNSPPPGPFVLHTLAAEELTRNRESRYGREGKVDAGEVTVPSTWLDDIKAELVEIAHGGKYPSTTEPVECILTSG